MSGEKVPSNFLTNVDTSEALEKQLNTEEMQNYAINIVRAMFEIEQSTTLVVDVPLDDQGEILIDRENYFGVYFQE